jgi:hypothetical protein
VREKDGNTLLYDSDWVPGKRVPYLPIIPLCGTAAADVGRRAFPHANDADGDRLRKAVAARVAGVGDALIATELKEVTNGLVRWAIRKGWQFGLASNVTDKAMEKITSELATLDRPENQ